MFISSNDIHKTKFKNTRNSPNDVSISPKQLYYFNKIRP